MIDNPTLNKKGIKSKAAQKAEIFPKLWCQKSWATNGKIAIESKIPAKGITQKIDRSAPSKCGAPASAAKIFCKNDCTHLSQV